MTSLSNVAHTKQERRPGRDPEAALCGWLGELLDDLVRSPSALLDDSTFAPPLLPSMLTNPRTVCFCQPVTPTISASVATFARFIIAITSAFLLLRSAVASALLVAAGLAFFDALAITTLTNPSEDLSS